jgi:hypothetical protein
MYWLKTYQIHSVQNSVSKISVSWVLTTKKDLFRYDFSHKTLESLYTTRIIQFGSNVFTEGF